VRSLSLLFLAVTGCASAFHRGPSPYSQWPEIAPSAYEHYIRGRLAVEHSQHELAVAEFRMASAVAPEEPELRVAIGEELLALGQLDNAGTEGDSIVANWPEHALGWRLVGEIRAHRADLLGAISAFERAVKLDPLDENAWLLLASTYRTNSDMKDAVATLRRLIAHVPASAEGHFRLGRALLAGKDLPAAEKELRRAVEIDPDHIDARVTLADVYREDGRPELASRTLREAFDRSGDDPSVGERLFRVLLDAGDRDAAYDLLKGIDADWRDVNIRLRLGMFFLQLHRADEALRIGASILTKDDTIDAARVLQARAFAQLGRRAEAIALCLRVRSAGEAFAEARALAGELHLKNGAPQEGLKIVEEALSRAPNEPQLVTVQAALYEKLGQLDRARVVLDEALTHAAADEALLYARASLEDRAGDPERGVGVMKTLLDKNGDNVTALNYIGYSLADRGVDLDTAERYLKRAIELRPDDGFVLDSFGWLQLKRDRLDEATRALERADRLAPFEPEILFHLGELYLRRGETPRARDTFRQALALDPSGFVRDRLEERMRTLEAKKAP
jgi:tetratricopeptide (TPR) repeat protein